jgi:hypothetical protein
MNIELKDKIKITDEYLQELISKSWHESENLQRQIKVLNVISSRDAKVVELLKQLLTNYQIFIGCLEGLSEETFEEVKTKAVLPEFESEPAVSDAVIEENLTDEITSLEMNSTDTLMESVEVQEPFEYFVDFDDPVGEPLTDKDLYND